LTPSYTYKTITAADPKCPLGGPSDRAPSLCASQDVFCAAAATAPLLSYMYMYCAIRKSRLIRAHSHRCTQSSSFSESRRSRNLNLLHSIGRSSRGTGFTMGLVRLPPNDNTSTSRRPRGRIYIGTQCTTDLCWFKYETAHERDSLALFCR
jgi:hypothetical protein